MNAVLLHCPPRVKLTPHVCLIGLTYISKVQDPNVFTHLFPLPLLPPIHAPIFTPSYPCSLQSSPPPIPSSLLHTITSIPPSPPAFDAPQSTHNRGSKDWTIKASYVEIYNENLNDLLTTEETRPVIKETKGGVFLDNVVRANITCYSDVQRIFSAGSSVRATGATIMNATSSRSHAIFSLIIKQRACDDTEDLSKITSKFHLIDLAGSERADSTGATGNRLKEGAMINQSLSALGKVIHALCAKDSGPQAKAAAGTRKGSTGKKAASFVPYRDSKLTRLLQDSLGGNSYTLMICNISPALICENETLGSLRFAARAKQIKNKAQISKLRLEVVCSSQRQPRIGSPSYYRYALMSPRHHRHNLTSTMLDCLSQQCHILCLVKTRPLLGPTAVQL